MRLADYVVSYSLQINNRCLRYLAECDARGGLVPGADKACDLTESHTVFTESLLTRDARRLASLWVLMEPGWNDRADQYTAHVQALQKAALHMGETNSARRMALRLASLAAEDHDAQAMLRVARNLPVETALTWEMLNDLFALDSQYWRDSSGFRWLDDQVLQQRVVRSYRKSYRLAMLYSTQKREDWLQYHGSTLHKWVQLSSHELELLRPGLSDKGKAQLWYLDKMSDSLRTRAGLLALRKAVAKARKAKTLKKAVAKLALAQVDEQLSKMDKRIERLVKGSFSQKPKKLNEVVQAATEALGLRDISLMQPQIHHANSVDNAVG